MNINVGLDQLHFILLGISLHLNTFENLTENVNAVSLT